uniref:Uncharacterized protein n=1 Tax=Ananas comosus var. bracteatus TaxID=296719 RepID=A0A6V7PVJ7_ANACO|nr:unnamed protein product [Ananas comosus var. bracteatus]
MEHYAALSNGDDAPSLSNGSDETLSQISHYSAAGDSHENIGGGGDGEFKGLMAEIGSLKAEKRELERQLEEARRERGVVAAEAHRLEGEIERVRTDLVAAASAAMDADALAEELRAERDKLRAEIEKLSAAAELKERAITSLERMVGTLEEAKEKAAKVSREREEDLMKRNAILLAKIQEKDIALTKLSKSNSSLEEEIIKLKDALMVSKERNAVLEGEIGEKTNDAEAPPPPPPLPQCLGP